ncbi:MAG: proprotein convertase P-domain-containing protein [Pseudomarimonas sp.]
MTLLRLPTALVGQILLFLALALPMRLASAADEPAIDPSRGVDASVDYVELTKLGPWDDRNYQLTAADLRVLPSEDRYVPGVPAFFKIQKRREMEAQGFPLDRHYPRELDKEFVYRFGGLLINGQIQRKGLGVYTHPDPKNPPPKVLSAMAGQSKAVPVEGEGPFDGTQSDNETNIIYSPANPNNVIAGSNGQGGQRHAYSSDGGVTWNSSGALPNSCCDPAMEWSPDGLVAYTATLGTQGGSCGGSFCNKIYWSTNFGQTWLGPVSVSTGSSDKEFIHVDHSPTSPYLGRLYTTWHQGNVMQFARCNYNTMTNALVCDPSQSFSADERGIGSDITTDPAGNVYYFWPTVTDNSAEIRVKVSTDGGTTFGTSIEVYDLHGDFDFPIPSMESRRAFIYVAAATDRSGGPNDGRVYVTLTDKHPTSPAGGGGAATANHAWVRVVYSDDQGATWTTATTPHSEADIATVDRYHPWIDVDGVGNVHLGFYDTRNSTNRTGVDWYYVYSPDGGTTWIEETRVSAIVSQNINDGQEWGDYNGLSASVGNTIAMTWTDNRITPPAVNPTQASYAGRVTNVGLGPTYSFSAIGAQGISLCAGTPVPDINLNVTGFQGFVDPVTFSTPGLNATVFPTVSFDTNPVTPTPTGASSVLSATTSASAASGNYMIPIRATGGMPPLMPIVRNASVPVTIFADSPAITVQLTPANAATDQSTRPTLTWTATPDAASYTVEIATDAAFTNIVATGTTTSTSFQPTTALLTETQYFWRVRATNTCGTGDFSTVRSFTTGSIQCFTGPVSIPDNLPAGASGSLAIANSGTIQDLDVSVRVTHTWPGDLNMRLRHDASNTTINLGTRLGGSGCQTDDVNATFNDEGGVAITCSASVPGIGGIITPQQALSAFDGRNFASNWTLTVIDAAGQDVGTLDEFCLMATTGIIVEPMIFRNGFETIVP